MRVIIFDYFGVLAHRYGQVDESMVEFIEQNLLGKYKLAVLSNMNSGNAEDMLDGHAKLFDRVMISGELGYGKPDVRAYLAAVSQLEEFPSDCLMIDDSQVNCAGAEDAGMQAIYYKDLESLKLFLADLGY